MNPTDQLFQRVAETLRTVRHARGLSQQALADAADVSRRMLAAIEAGNANASLAILDRLAHALGLTFADLVREPAPDAPSASLPVTVWQGPGGESRGRLLASVPARGAVELWEWTLAPGDRYLAEADRPGTQELVYVAAGTLTLELLGERRVVEEGASLAYPSDQPYAYRNEGDRPLRFIRSVVG
jgi:transcriptional regulator with XRE-family HTH domain